MDLFKCILCFKLFQELFLFSNNDKKIFSCNLLAKSALGVKNKCSPRKHWINSKRYSFLVELQTFNVHIK